MYREDTTTPLPPDRSILVVGMNGSVYGLDRTTGEIRWENNLRGGLHGEVFIAVDYGVVVASAAGQKLFCLDYLTGALRWQAPTSASGRASILIEADHIVCAKGGYIDCFDPAGGPRWQQPLTGAGAHRIALGYPGNVAQADNSEGSI